MTPRRDYDELGPSHAPAHLQRRRKGDQDGFLGIKWPVVVQVVTWVVALFGIYVATTSRLTTLEVQRVEDSRRMERIEQKLDRALEQWRQTGGGRP